MTAERHRLGVAEAARAVHDRTVTAEDLVRASLGRIDTAERDVQAWTFLDRELALRQARAVPLGAQLVGRRDDDGRLLCTARWLADRVRPAS